MLHQMMTDSELESALRQMPHQRVTLPEIEARIVQTSYLRLGETVTLCHLVLDNGYSVRGESACVDAGNYNQSIGEKLAREQAISKLWPLFGFLLAEARHLRSAK